MQAYNNKRKGEEVSKHIGNFVPVEERKEVAKEIKRSHFTLGSDKGKSPTFKISIILTRPMGEFANSYTDE
jgi:hypothetical protein